MPVKFLTDTAVAKRKKDLPLINNVEITDVAAEGNALARINDMVVFTERTKIMQKVTWTGW